MAVLGGSSNIADWPRISVEKRRRAIKYYTCNTSLPRRVTSTLRTKGNAPLSRGGGRTARLLRPTPTTLETASLSLRRGSILAPMFGSAHSTRGKSAGAARNCARQAQQFDANTRDALLLETKKTTPIYQSSHCHQQARAHKATKPSISRGKKNDQEKKGRLTCSTKKNPPSPMGPAGCGTAGGGAPATTAAGGGTGGRAEAGGTAAAPAAPAAPGVVAAGAGAA